MSYALVHMFERPYTHTHEAAEETGNRYLANLGLEWSGLKGKKILDVGALNAEFEHAARQRGIEVISIDKSVDFGGEYMPPRDSKFVIANATTLPFRDASFDYVVAHMSVMQYVETSYREKPYLLYMEDVLREIHRTLIPGGQFRFTDTSLDESDLRKDEDVITPEKNTPAHDEWRMEREHETLERIAKRVGFSELKVVKYPESHPGQDEYILSHYFIATK